MEDGRKMRLTGIGLEMVDGEMQEEFVYANFNVEKERVQYGGKRKR